MGNFDRGDRGDRRDSRGPRREFSGSRGGSGGPRRESGGGGYGGGSRNFDGPREMHDAVCAECGQECKVPFVPKEGRDVFCRDCYAKKRATAA